MPNISASTNIDAIQLQEQASAPTDPASGYAKLYADNAGHLHYINDGSVDYQVTFTPEQFFSALQMTATTTAGAATGQTETTTNKVNFQSFDFDQTTQEHINFTWISPDDWDAGTVTFKAYWSAAAGSGTVVWGLQGIAFADDDALDTAFGTAQTSTDTLLATGDMHISPVSSAITIAGTPVAGEPVVFQIYRDVATDTLTGDAQLIGIKLYYTRA